MVAQLDTKSVEGGDALGLKKQHAKQTNNDIDQKLCSCGQPHASHKFFMGVVWCPDHVKKTLLSFKRKMQPVIYTALISIVNVIMCLPLRIAVWAPLALILGLVVAPLSLLVIHLPFDTVPWWKQLAWHYAMVMYMANVPFIDSLELMRTITNSFLPDLEKKFGKKKTAFMLKPLEEMSKADFERLGEKGFKNSYHKNWLPVKINNMCPNLPKEWNMARFARTHGDTKVFVFKNHKKTEVVPMKFSELASRVQSGQKTYARAISQIVKGDPEVLKSLPLDRFGRLRDTLMGADFDNENAILQFFSAKGTWTQVHADVTCNFNIQFEGQKRWVIFSPAQTMLMYPFAKGTNQFFQASYDLSGPDLEKFPCLKYAQGFEMIMNPGDMLWLPSWWWHGIENLSTPAAAVACDGVGKLPRLLSSNLSMTMAFLAHPYNCLEFFVSNTEDIAKRWTL